jgi:DNA-binding SARP family transcriptional activator/WD40 repeat protein/class 3 adenylate cyclase/energy-coupling factor transporter ATP-binding protein EcfA2
MVAGGVAGALVETWTVLFTDQVGSTAMRVRVGEGTFDAIRTDLDARVEAALTAHGVVVTKSTGDGIMGGFTSTAAALRCAVAIQQAVAEWDRTAGVGVAAPEALALRIGISVGDAVVENGDLQGTAVVEAARLCATAPDGAILCSEAVRVVSANRSGCTFGPASPVHLKGLPGPVRAHEVSWEPLPYDPREHRLTFRVLGPLEVLDRDRPVRVGGPKERLVLALLLARVNSVVSVDALVDAVWGDRPPRTAERTVHAYVARLRRTLEPRRPRGEPSTTLATVGRGYELRLDAAQLDSSRFEELAKRGSDQLERGDDAASSTLRQALGLWRAEAFGEFPDVEGCVAEARRLEELRLALVEDLVDADLADGRSSELVGEIDTLLRDEPFRERLWGQLIVALYRSGRQRDALEAYQRVRRLLTDELGIEPGPDLRRLEAAVLAQDSSLDVLRPLPAAARAGLPAALAAVGPAFLGRETELAWLREAWADAVDGRGGFVSVLGPEGIGKTRLVAELARGIHDDGATVLYGRCDHAHRGARALLGQAVQSAGSSFIDVYRAAADDGDIAEAVARYLPTWSQGRPVLVVLDDLHLADAETLEVVADLAGWCRAAPMLVVGAFRNDTVPPTGPTEAAGGAASQLALGPLSGDAVARICELYATEPWSTEDVSRVSELTGGVPLLVHEQASEWARERASRRMADASDRMAVTHRRLVASRSEIADGVEGIQRLLEQRRAQLAGREAQLQASVVASLGGCPYKGLTRFEAADAANFFGRERLVAELIARLAESPLLAVVGPSGSGKSSLVRAGLLPALDSGILPAGQQWRSTILCPGPHPAQELARRLHDADHPAGEPRIVFVDQFEETFTAGSDRTEQEEFIGRLLDLVDRPDTAVVLAIRADHLGRCATYPELADRLTGNDVLVGPMRDTELRRTVELPAQRAGLETEAGLVEVIVGDVAGRAGALPLLSTALAETWERRQGRALTLTGYRAAGGVNGALARMAEDAYAALLAGPRTAARRLLLRLCDAGTDGDLSLRRRLPVAEAADDHDTDARAALDTLADHRLLTIDSDSVEVAHEALLREWPRLRTWLAEDVQGRRLHRRLHDATRSWEAADHDPSELYRGTRLGAATDWAASHHDELSQAERTFLAASTERQETDLTTARRRVRRLRTLVAGVTVFAAMAVAAGAVAFVQRDRANDAATAADARRVGAQALVVDDIAESLLLAVEGLQLDDSPDTRANLLAALSRNPAMIGSAPTDDVPTGLDTSPDGEVIAVGSGPAGVSFRDADTMEPLGILDVPSSQLKFRPNSGQLAIAASEQAPLPIGESGPLPVLLADATTFEQEPTQLGGLPSRRSFARDLRYSADGRFLAASFFRISDDGLFFSVAVWDVTAPDKPIRSIDLPPPLPFEDPSYYVALSPDGSLLYVGATDPPSVTVYQVATGQRQLFARVSGDRLEINPDGSLLAVAAGNEILVLDAATLKERGRLRGHTDRLKRLRFSHDGALLASASDDRTAIVWEVATGNRQEQLGGHATSVGDLEFSADDSTLYTASQALLAWDLAGGRRFTPRHAIAEPVSGPEVDPRLRSVDSAPGGDAVAYVVTQTEGPEPRSTVQWLDLTTGKAGEVADIGLVLDPAHTWRPDGRRFATAGFDGLVQVWDWQTGELVLERRVTQFPITGLDYTRDGTQLVVGGEFGRMRIIDAETLAPVLPTLRLDRDHHINRVSASPDNRTAIATWPGFTGERPADAGFALVDLVDGRVLHEGPVAGVPSYADFSPDGQRVAVSYGDRVGVLDVETGEWMRPPVDSHEGAVPSLAYAPDGAVVASGGSDGRVGLWDGRTGALLGTVLPGQPNSPATVEFLPDGHTVQIASLDGAVYTWDTRPQHWVDYACKVVGRNLTQDEWRDTFGDRRYHRTCPQYPAGE